METKCTQSIIDRVRPLVESGVTWPKIAVAVGVGESTLRHWRQEGSANYVAEFAEIIKAAIEAMDCGKIKAGQIEQAQKHILKTMELQETGPQMPPSWFPKNYIVDYADQFLDLVLDPRTTVGQMRAECFLRVTELSKVKMVVTKEAEVDPNQAAVKNVLTNTGKKEERWNFKDEIEHEAGKELKSFMDWLAGRDGTDDRSDAA